MFYFTILLFLVFSNLEAKLFNAKSFTLSNGLQVVVVENKRAPVISSMIWYDVGSADEEYGKSGLAHFLEHLMFKGTKKFPGSTFSNFISKNGGSENAFTSYDYTAYFQTISSDKIEEVLEMEADRMKNLVLTNDQVETEKKVILEERNQRIDSRPSSILDQDMRKSLFPNHTYGIPIIGWNHEIINLTYDDVIEFYNKYYVPTNAKLILSGNINYDRAKAIAKKYFGNISSKKNKSERKYLKDPEIISNINLTLDHQDVKQKVWKRIYKSSSIVESITKGIALDFGLEIIAGGKTSFLYKKLVEEKKLFSSVGGYYQGFTKGPATIYFYAVPIKDLSEHQIKTEIDTALQDAVKIGIAEEEFERKKKKYFYNSIYQRDSIGQPAQILGEALSIGLSIDEVLNWDRYIENLTIDDVMNELKVFIKNKNFVSGLLE
tara:strand:+ start:1011 stop:2315 length:1305 start_codon:yes stop_codon:yes gene_type:complete